MSKFKVGDKVKVVNYGSLMWINLKNNDDMLHAFRNYSVYKETEDVKWIDSCPDLIGQEGIITEVSSAKREYQNYILDGVLGKSAWYDGDQLELISS